MEVKVEQVAGFKTRGFRALPFSERSYWPSFLGYFNATATTTIKQKSHPDWNISNYPAIASCYSIPSIRSINKRKLTPASTPD